MQRDMFISSVVIHGVFFHCPYTPLEGTWDRDVFACNHTTRANLSRDESTQQGQSNGTLTL